MRRRPARCLHQRLRRQSHDHARAVPSDGAGVRAVAVELLPTAYRFRRGHRLRVQVCGGSFPRFARNTGTGEPLATGSRTAVVDYEILDGSAITLLRTCGYGVIFASSAASQASCSSSLRRAPAGATEAGHEEDQRDELHLPADGDPEVRPPLRGRILRGLLDLGERGEGTGPGRPPTTTGTDLRDEAVQTRRCSWRVRQSGRRAAAASRPAVGRCPTRSRSGKSPVLMWSPIRRLSSARRPHTAPYSPDADRAGSPAGPFGETATALSGRCRARNGPSPVAHGSRPGCDRSCCQPPVGLQKPNTWT